MARVNSLLSIMVDQNANELRLVSEREPRIFAYGAQKRLSIPKMSDETVRDFLGEILTTEVLSAVSLGGRAEIQYDAGSLGSYVVTLSAHEGNGIAAAFVKASRSSSSSSTASAPSAPAIAPRASAASAPSFAAAEPVPASTPSPVQTTRLSPTQRLQSLLARAVQLRASDVHLADGDVPTVRVDGKLRALDQEAAVDVAQIFGFEEAHAPGAMPRSIDAGLDVPGVGRVRIHVYSTSGGRAAAIRLLAESAPSFAALEMPFAFDDVVSLPHGLVLLAGATGSGKSTTLASLAEEAMKRRSIVLVTLEDPIEYRLSAHSSSIVRRRQVGRDVPSFAAGLREALREDPDVLLVGEMRDPETIALALTAAETGHLVLASIHSRSAASAVDRIVDSYSAEQQAQIRVQLAESLRVVVAQRLVRRARGGGRVPVVEVMRGTRAIASLIREGKTAQIPTAIQQGRREGMLSLERCLADKVSAGEISHDDARAAANDVELLQSYLQRKSMD